MSYLQDPDLENRRSDEWRDLAIAIPMSFAVFVAMDQYQDTVSAALTLPPFVYEALQYTAAFVVLNAVKRLLQRRRSRRSS